MNSSAACLLPGCLSGCFSSTSLLYFCRILGLLALDSYHTELNKARMTARKSAALSRTPTFFRSPCEVSKVIPSTSYGSSSVFQSVMLYLSWDAFQTQERKYLHSLSLAKRTLPRPSGSLPAAHARYGDRHTFELLLRVLTVIV